MASKKTAAKKTTTTKTATRKAGASKKAKAPTSMYSAQVNNPKPFHVRAHNIKGTWSLRVAIPGIASTEVATTKSRTEAQNFVAVFRGISQLIAGAKKSK